MILNRRQSPLWAAFLGSCLLSLIAIQGNVTPNNDGMAYIEAARLYQLGGFEAAKSLFDWNAFARTFIAVAIAGASSLSRLGLETAAYVLSTLLLAGACTAMVAAAREYLPESGWAACLTALAVPGLNNYRDYILREFGAWFFLALALWLLARWLRLRGWRDPLGALVCIALASLFRPESVLFLLLFPGHYLLSAWALNGAKRLRHLLLALIPAALLLVAGYHWLPQIFDSRLLIWNPWRESGAFASAVRNLQHILPRWAAGEATTILLIGILALVPKKLFGVLGVFSLPLLFHLWQRQHWPAGHSRRIFWLAILLYVALLSWFAVERLYLSGRYAALFAMLFLPFIAAGLHQLYEIWPRRRKLLLLLGVTLAVSNVVSLSPGKTRYADAARWLAGTSYTEGRVYLEAPEVAHLLGWSFYNTRKGFGDRNAVFQALRAGQLDLAIFDQPANAAPPVAVADGELVVLKRFVDRRDQELLVLSVSRSGKTTR